MHASLQVLPYRAILARGAADDRQTMVMGLFDSGRAEAPGVLRQALRDPDERIRLLAAQALERLTESYRRSVQAMRRAVEEKPSDARAKLELARLLFNHANDDGPLDAGTGAFEEAERLLVAALIEKLAAPEDDAAWLLLGQSRARLGRTVEAREAFDHVPERSPYHVASRLAWAETKIADGDVAAARGEMRRLAALSSSLDVSQAVRFWETT